MTDLLKPVKRRTALPHRGRRIVVTLEPGDLIGFRAERTRKTFYMPLAAMFDCAVRSAVMAERAERRKLKQRKG